MRINREIISIIRTNDYDVYSTIMQYQKTETRCYVVLWVPFDLDRNDQLDLANSIELSIKSYKGKLHTNIREKIRQLLDQYMQMIPPKFDPRDDPWP